MQTSGIPHTKAFMNDDDHLACAPTCCRSEAKNFVTYPIRYWAPQLYSTPQTAKEIATWMERQSKDGIMRVRLSLHS